MIRKIFAPAFIALLLVTGTFFMTNLGYERPVHAVEVPQNLVANLSQRVEELQSEVALLRKQILLFTDLLDDMAKALKAQTPTHANSVRSIPQPPTPTAPATDLTTQANITKLKASTYSMAASFGVNHDEAVKVCSQLLTTTKNSSFVKSLQTQLLEWLDTPSTRTFDFPFSQKQFAWVAFLMLPGEYANPKTIKSLYPNG